MKKMSLKREMWAMKLTAKEAASLIDISAVRTHHSLGDLEALVEYGRKYRFINIHVLPCWVATLADRLQDVEGVYVGSPVGFPSGAAKTVVKMLEAQQLLEDGVQEMDIVMNVGRFKNEEYQYVLKELREIIGMTDGKVLTKVIIEMSLLDDTELIKACELVTESGADFVKTGTGWVSGGLDIGRIKKIKDFCGDRIKVKAAGGIRTREEFLTLYDMGVERMGINAKSAIEIVESFTL
jgi:deoxyribose-phosphate aldolase